MWVADMDFPVAPEIQEALKERAGTPFFGYTLAPDAWYDAYIGWWKKRHSFEIRKDWLFFSEGVVSAIMAAVGALCAPGEGVAILTPLYHALPPAIAGSGRVPVEVPMLYESGQYSVPWDIFEAALARPSTTAFILCNPHNPAGILWDKDTLLRMGQLCEKHGVTVLSDEIHCDLVDPGLSYTPFASVSPACSSNSATFVAPSKSFNIAGLQSAAVFCENPNLRGRIKDALARTGMFGVNAFAMPGTIAAYTKCAAWLDDACAYIAQNKTFMMQYLESNVPEVRPVYAPATYLMWLDCSVLTDDSHAFQKALRKRTGLFVSSGHDFLGNGNLFLRMNVACPRARVKDAAKRIEDFVASLS